MKKRTPRTQQSITPPAPGRSPRRLSSGKAWLLALTLALLAAVLYLPALHNGFLLNYDDNLYITDNTHIRSLGGEFFRWALFDYKTNMWHPLTWLSHALDYTIWGMDPFGHHLSSVLLHAVNTAIVFFLSRQFLNLTWQAEAGTSRITIAAGMTALLFGIHPVHVESVAWVTERRDLLYSLFYMLSLSSYLRYANKGGSGGNPWSFLAEPAYRTALLLYGCSLASKPMAVTLPLVLLLCDWYPLQRRPQRQHLATLLREKLPFIALTLPVALMTVLAQQQVGAIRPFAESPVPLRIMLALKSLAHYLYNVIAPNNLLPLYFYPTDLSPARPEYYAGGAAVAAITLICILLRQKRYLATAWLFFVITLLPVIGLMQVGVQSMANRYIYLSSLAVFLLLGTGAARLLTVGSNTARRLGILLALLGYASWLSVGTVRYLDAWQDSITLYRYTLEKSRDHEPCLHIYLASAYERVGMLEKTREEFDQAFAEIAALLAARPDLLRLYVIRGDLNMLVGNFEQALQDYQAACSRGLQEGCRKSLFPFGTK